MYAILSHGGRQYRVSAGDRLIVDRLEAEVGSMVALEPVLLTGGDGTTGLGKDLDGVRVAATVIAHPRGRKLRIFKYKAKKRSRKMAGYRSNLTELRVESILAKGAVLPKSVDSSDDAQPLATTESPPVATRTSAPAAKARTRATAAAAPSAPAAIEPAEAAPVRKTGAKRAAAPTAAVPTAAAPTADAVVVDEPDTAEAGPGAGATATPKPAARTPKAAPKTSKRGTAAKDSADAKETGDGA